MYILVYLKIFNKIYFRKNNKFVKIYNISLVYKMSEIATFSSWPITGSKPVLSCYYNFSLDKQLYFQQGFAKAEVINKLFNISRIETPIFANNTDLSANPIGYINIDLTIGKNTFSSIYRILLNSDNKLLNSTNSISFERNGLQGDYNYGTKEIWRVTNGNGIYLYDVGYVQLTSYENGDTFIEVYSGILKEL